MKRVLCVLDSFSFGGAEHLVAELAKHSAGRFDVRVASLAPQSQGRNAMKGRLAEAGLDPTHLDVNRLIDPAGFMRLVRALRESDADVVHAHLGYAATLVPVAAAIAGKPVVATLHHVPEDLSRREWVKERASVRAPASFGRLVLVSNPAFDEFAERHGPATGAWRMIHNGVDLTSYSMDESARPAARDALRHSLGLDSSTQVWAAVAALREPKGHLDLLRAWAGVRRELATATPHLLLVGDGPHAEVIDNEIAELGLAAHIHRLGRRDDVPSILAGADAVVSASYTEALPTALIEAGAAGLPVVATKAGGTTDVIHHGINGALVEVGDVNALAGEVTSLARCASTRRAWGRAGASLADRRFSMEHWIDTLDELYDEVIESPRYHGPAPVREPYPTSDHPHSTELRAHR